MDLVILLDRLDQLIESAPEIPLTGKSLINAEEALDLLDKIRNSIPEQVKRAEWLSSERDRVVQEGEAEAERILSQAEEYVTKLVSESEISQKAAKDAERILEAAHAQAHDIQAGADEYALSVLNSLENSLEQTLQVIRKGRGQLAG